MLEPRISARKEAAPIAKWEELFPTQRNIIVEIHEWLTDFLSREHQADIPGLGEPVTKSFLPSIDHDRRNNVLLLNGARGCCASGQLGLFSGPKIVMAGLG